MSNEDFSSRNGKDRRKVEDRRKNERRDSKRDTKAGVLTSRAGERRKKTRRKKDAKTS